jgi:YidC/Oxa1 family membrane protein insertase
MGKIDRKLILSKFLVRSYLFVKHRNASLLSLSLALFFLRFTALPVNAETIKLENSSLTVEVSEQQGSITSWVPKALTSESAPIHDFAQLAKQLFRLGGFVKGEAVVDLAVQSGGWEIVHSSPDFVHLKLVNLSFGYELHQSLQLDDLRPWQADYAVWLHTRHDEAVEGTFWVDIGPGLGEAPAQGLGAAQSLYSYTQGVVATNSGVKRFSSPPNVYSSDNHGRALWLGLQTRYFAFLVTPANNIASWELTAPDLAQRYRQNPEFVQTMRVQLSTFNANEVPVKLTLFGGGKSYPVLKSGHSALNELMFADLWRWMRALTLSLMYVLDLIYGLIGSWGVAILLLAVFVRLFIHPVAKRAMAAQKQFVALQEKIQPELRAIKKNYRGGEQSEMVLQLYEKHKTSPLAGLKPLLIVLLQLPIFVALYHLLGQHFELRGQSFLWMNSLAEPDQLFSIGYELPFFGSYFNLLPALMAFTTLLTIKLSPAPTLDATSSWRHNILLIGMALGFFVLFYTFPSGMVLYWTAANLLHLLHAVVGKGSGS